MLGLGNSLGKTSSNITPGAGGSPPPLGLDKTWSFDSDVEGWQASGNGTVAYQASYTPSSDTEKTGILTIERTNNSSESTLIFDLSALTDYDSSSVLYYEITYSIPQNNPSSITYTGLNRVRYGATGFYDDYSAVNSQTFNTWITVDGDLNPGGLDDTLYISWDPSSFIFVSGAKVFIDSIRVSHTDFR